MGMNPYLNFLTFTDFYTKERKEYARFDLIARVEFYQEKFAHYEETTKTVGSLWWKKQITKNEMTKIVTRTGTTLYMTSGDKTRVLESPEEVMNLIKNAGVA
jgi:hypothetical protein